MRKASKTCSIRPKEQPRQLSGQKAQIRKAAPKESAPALPAKQKKHHPKDRDPDQPELSLRRAKIVVKVEGEKEKLFEDLYLHELEFMRNEELDLFPRPSSKHWANEPNPNTFRFPAEFRRKARRGTARNKDRKAATAVLPSGD